MSTAAIKKISLGVAGFVAALIFGYFFKMTIGSASTANLVGLLLSAILFLSAFLIQTVIGSDKFISPLFIVLEVLGISLFFFGNFSPVLLIGIISGLGLLITAYYQGGSEINNNLDIHFIKNSRIIMASATMALAIFVSFAYVGSFDIKNPVAAKKGLELVVNPLTPLVSGYIPGFSSQNTLKDIALAALPADFKLASPAQKADAVSQISTRLADTLSGAVGTSVFAGDRVIDIVYKATIGRLAGLSAVAQTGVLVLFGIVFFFMIKFALFFIDWAAVFTGFGIYKLLLAFGFFKIEVQNVPKRVIVL